MYKQFCTFLAIAAVSTTSFASFKQKITVCGIVDSFKSTARFKVLGKSSDVFDFGFGTELISQGKVCKLHTYKEGPKNMTFRLKSRGSRFGEEIRVTADPMCALQKGFYNQLVSSTKRITAKNATVTFHITQQHSSDKNASHYHVSCSYQY